MMNNEFNPFASFADEKPENSQPVESKEKFNPFAEMKPDEPWYKSYLRSALQLPLGVLKKSTWQADVVQLLGMGAALDEEDIENLRKTSERVGVPFDEEKYRAGVQEALSVFPTQSNIERGIESYTGIPLTPQTKGQKLTRLSGESAAFAPSSLSQKATAGIVAPATSAALQASGVPEVLSDIAGTGLSQVASRLVPAGGPQIKTGESGLPVRRYEKIKSPTKVSESRLNIINETLENDFRKVSDKIIETSKIGETYSSLKNDPSYKRIVGEQFEQVHDIASSLEKPIPIRDLKIKIADTAKQKTGKGISPSEYEINYSKNMKKSLKGSGNKDLKAVDLVDQFRKNNEELGRLYEPGQSKSYNQAKTDSLLDYNRAIAETIEKNFPDTEFSQLFKKSNAEWSSIKDVEFIEKFIDDMTKGKVDFKTGDKFYNKSFSDKFTRSLGKESFKEFDTLMGDLMSKQQSLKYISPKSAPGAQELLNTGGLFLFHPKVAALKYGYNTVKSSYQMLLDKPQLTIKWDNGIKAFKKGDVNKAQSIFSELKKEMSTLEKSRISALKKFNSNKS
jgi:hypothetical protein